MQYYIPIDLKDNKFKLSKEDNHHIINVLRLKNGDLIYVIYNNSRFKCRIFIVKNVVDLEIVDSEAMNNELPIKIRLVYGLPRLEKFELVLQKAVELGVSEVIPFKSEFSIVKIEDDKLDAKMLRWNRIVKEASEQSHRSSLMNVSKPVKIEELKNSISELNILANEYFVESGTSKLLSLFKAKFSSITILVGPEGGFAKDEVKEFENLGFISVSLGKRILRSETAAMYLMSVISMLSESLD